MQRDNKGETATECGERFITEAVPKLNVPGGRVKCNMSRGHTGGHQLVRDDGLVLTPAKRYTPGQHCRRGTHAWTEDHGTWARCGKCGSTRQKPSGLSIADWLNMFKVKCPDCDGTGVDTQYTSVKASVCSLCGGDGYMTRVEYNSVRRMRAGGSPNQRLPEK